MSPAIESKRLQRQIELCAKTERTRYRVSNLANYFIGERLPSGRMHIFGRRHPMVFWKAYSVKQGLNTGRKHARYFVVTSKGQIVGTIDHKIMTTALPPPRRTGHHR